MAYVKGPDYDAGVPDDTRVMGRVLTHRPQGDRATNSLTSRDDDALVF